MLSSFLLKSDKFLKHCIPEAFRNVPEDYPEAKPEGKNQYAKHRIPEGNRKVPEGFLHGVKHCILEGIWKVPKGSLEVKPEGFVDFFIFVRSRLARKGWN